jgi:hypothetical protein
MLSTRLTNQPAVFVRLMLVRHAARSRSERAWPPAGIRLMRRIRPAPRSPPSAARAPSAVHSGQAGCDGLFSRQQRTKSWTTALVSAAGGQATPTWLGLTPVTGR